jgi:hypothetical protein
MGCRNSSGQVSRQGSTEQHPANPVPYAHTYQSPPEGHRKVTFGSMTGFDEESPTTRKDTVRLETGRKPKRHRSMRVYVVHCMQAKACGPAVMLQPCPLSDENDIHVPISCVAIFVLHVYVELNNTHRTVPILHLVMHVQLLGDHTKV